MHPNLEDLLDFRDGEAPEEVASHVAACPACAAEVEGFRRTAAELRSLPALRPRRDLWPQVRAAALARRGRRRWEIAGGAVLALAASLAIFLILPRGGAGTPPPEVRPAHDELAVLMQESRRLESALGAYGPAGGVMDGRSASAVADLEDAIALIDSRLAHPVRGRSRPGDPVDLWRERVQLMNALVNVRTNDARPVYAGL